MPDAGDDQLAGGDDREPVPFPTWAKVLIAVLGVAAVAFALTRSGGDDRTDAAPGPTPSASGVSPRPTVTGYPPLEGPMALVGQTCVTTRQDTFTVVLGLQNNSLGRATVLSVSAHLPLGGLDPLGGRVPAARTCGGAAVDPGTRTVLEPGDRIPVSLSFRQPDTCPAPEPVQVDVALLGGGETPRTQRVAVLSDLGGYQDAFAACGAP